MNVDKTKFNYQINGLRAFLLLFVVLSHFTYVFFLNVVPADSGSLDSFTRFFGEHIANNLGAASVCVFFFLSGYFLSIKTVKEYSIKKVFSIIIPFIFCLLLILLCRIIFSSFQIKILDVSMNFLILPMASNLFSYIDGAHWYIIQLCLFFVYFLIIYLVSKALKKDVSFYLMVFLTIMSLIAVILPSGVTLFSIIKALFFQGIAFISFGYFTRAFITKKIPFKNKYAVASFMISAFVITIVVAFKRYDWVKMIFYLVLLIITFLCIFNKVKFLELKAFQVIGSSSFIMYVIHQELGYLIILQFYNNNLYWRGVFFAIVGLFGISFLINYLWNVKTIPIIYSHILHKNSVTKVTTPDSNSSVNNH